MTVERQRQLLAVAFTALSRAVERWNLPVADREEIAAKVLAALQREIETTAYQEGFADGERHAYQTDIDYCESSAAMLERSPSSQDTAGTYRQHAEHLKAAMAQKTETIKEDA